MENPIIDIIGTVLSENDADWEEMIESRDNVYEEECEAIEAREKYRNIEQERRQKMQEELAAFRASRKNPK